MLLFLIVLVILLVLFLFSACLISSRCSRWEENNYIKKEGEENYEGRFNT